MKILLIGNEQETAQLRAAMAAENCTFESISSRAYCALPKDSSFSVDAALVSRDHGHHDAFPYREALLRLPFVAAIGAENTAAGIMNISAQDNSLCNEYVLYGGEENLRRLLRFIRHKLYGSPKPAAAEKTPFDSIYTMDGKLYDNTADYLQTEEVDYEAYVGLLNYRNRWLAADLSIDRALKQALNRRGIGVIPVFTNGSADPELGALSMEEAVERFFCKNGSALISLLVNFIFFGSAEGEKASMFARSADFYNRLGVPVVRPSSSSYLSKEQWAKSEAPFSSDSALNFDVAEMQGMIEPLFIAGAKDRKTHEVVEERAEKLAERISGWISLRKTENKKKKLAVFLNSAVCSGVEATLGRAAGLNSFESVMVLLRRLKKEGYDVGELPASGEELRQLFLEKKAFSDFRWTAAEDIAAAGGVQYAMSLQEYDESYRLIPQAARDKVENTWGKAPGEAMVLDGKLLITGLQFGNVLLMIQPKRGCYGAKCTGEVCKILQDPNCPPTHQYLATYFYAAQKFGAHAWIHMGTHGSLEYLPGKASGLSGECFPDICVGGKPNLYVYNAASVGPAMLAKRRSYAVLCDHPMRQEAYILQDSELDSLVKGLNGLYLLPGEGGDRPDLESGRNLYGVQLDHIPTPTAYERGSQAAEELAARFLKEEGHYPQQIALNMISLDIPRTGGEQFSLFLRLLGLRPVWKNNGEVDDLELIPLSELKRPRLDVAVQVSSVLRDAWPEILERMDEAVLLVAALDETAEENYLVKNTKGAAEQVDRIFGAAPGTYANSVGLALKASAWNSETDLARYFVDSSSYAYGKGKKGRKSLESFLGSIRRTEATCDLISMKHSDALRSSHSSRIQGSYAMAAKLLGAKRAPRSFMGESAQDGVAVKTMQEHLNDGLKSSILNEEWKNQQLQQGYDGAAEIMCRLQNLFEMQCVGESFSSETLDEIAKQYLLDEKLRRFMEKNNPYAAEESARRFLELNSRGKWKPAAEILRQLQKSYLKTEASLEDGISGLGEIQGGGVDIVSDRSVDSWSKRLQTMDKELETWKQQNS